MQKKVFLCYPPISKFERYSSQIGSAGGEQIPLGIYYLAAKLKEEGYQPEVTDAEAENLSHEQILSKITEFSPGFVGISSTTVAFHRALELAQEIKKYFKDIVIILGGPHVTSNYEHAIAFDVFDYGVIGEGEITLIELLRTIEKGGDIDAVKGIVYRRDNKIVCNRPREYIEDMDSIPFPALEYISDLNLYKPPPSNYKSWPVINMITSRGCPSQCTFCDRNVFGKMYRMRSAENVVDEIEKLQHQFGVKEIAFVDDTFLLNKKRVYRIFEIAEKRGISFSWNCMSRINNVDLDFLKFLKSKGCWHLSFGIESGDEGILELIKKHIKLDRAREVIEWCRSLKIKTKGFFIIGHPSETMETIDKTIQFALELKLDDVVVTLNTPIPGTVQFQEAQIHGSLDTSDWSKYNCWNPIFIPDGLTEEILLSKQKEFYRKFYLRPRIIFRYVLGFFNRGGLKRLISLLKASSYLISRKKSG